MENCHKIIEFTEEEKKNSEKIRILYNKGNIRESYKTSSEFYKNNPKSLVAKFEYGVMTGECVDYSKELQLSENQQYENLGIAKKIIKEVYDNPDLKYYPTEFYCQVCNEYFWFHQLPFEQYSFGVEMVSKGVFRSYYSQCVGASTYALKLYKEGHKGEGIKWANIAIKAFCEFEKVDPTWHNINYFYAQSLLILGDFEKAKKAITEMFEKQGAQIDIEKIDQKYGEIFDLVMN